MPRARWFVAGFLLVAVVLGGVLNERGPFASHPALAYDRFLHDVQVGEVDQVVQWRDELEVTEQGSLLSVVVPTGHDPAADLAQARDAGGAGTSFAFAHIPDAWLGLMTPWVPLVLSAAAMLIWVTSVARNRGFESPSSRASGPRPAGS